MKYRNHSRREFLTTAGTVATLAAIGGETRAGSSVDPVLEEKMGKTDVVFRLERLPRQGERESSSHRTIKSLRNHAEETQRELLDSLSGIRGVDVGRQFWLANAIIATVDLDTVSLERLTQLEHVQRVHSTELPGTRGQNSSSTGLSPADEDVFAERDVSWAVELVNAPAVWEHYDARGEGARICIIDTGVDAEHPDIDLDGWVEFDEQGQRVDSEPNEPNPEEASLAGHGTGMSSVATGGDASGMQIGVAPAADLYVAGFESYNFPAVMASLEWAVENDADVASMSFTMEGQWANVIEPFQNAVDAGTLPITITEWPLPFTFNATTPAALTTGSLDKTLSPRKGSNGGYVRWDRALRDVDTAAWWPAESFSPDLTLAGAEVPNAIPLDMGAYFDYIDEENYGPDRNWATMPGVSNTPPATAGVIALLLSATDEQLTPEELRESVRETALQPPESKLPVPNDQYGHGIPNAARLVHQFVDPERRVSGTVVDDSGDPVGAATVVTESGSETATDAAGSFTLSTPEGTDSIRAWALGYEPAEQSLETGQSNVEIIFENRTEPQLDIPQGYPTRVDAGATLTVEATVEHANSAQVEMESTGRRVDPGDIELLIDGTTTQPGDPVDFPSDTDTVPVEIRFEDAARGMVELEITVANVDGEVTTAAQELDPVHVHDQPMTVSEEDPLQQSMAVAAPDTTVELAGDEWVVETTPANMETPEVLLDPNTRLQYAHPVLVPAQDDPTGLLVDRPLTLTAASGHGPTITIRDDSNSDRSVGIRIAASYVTVSGVEVDAGGAASGIHVLNGVGVDIDNVTVANARDAILGELTMSLLVRSCALRGTESGVRLSWLGWNARIADNEIQTGTAGIALDTDFIIARARLSGNRFADVGTAIVTQGEGQISYEQTDSSSGSGQSDSGEDSSNDESSSDDDNGSDSSEGSDGDESADESEDAESEDESSSSEPTPTEPGGDTPTQSAADEDGAGFGVSASLAGLAGVGYLLRRFRESEADE